jgi:hypothetical protein
VVTNTQFRAATFVDESLGLHLKSHQKNGALVGSSRSFTKPMRCSLPNLMPDSFIATIPGFSKRRISSGALHSLSR